MWNDGGGTFTAGPNVVGAFYGGDFAGDGDLGFASPNPDASGFVPLYLHDGPRSLFDHNGPFGPVAHVSGLGDVDGDGATDIIVRSSNDTPAPPGTLFPSYTYVTSVYLSTAKHPGPANPDIQCGSLTPSQCSGPLGF